MKVEDNPLTKHWLASHQGDETEPTFTMEILRKFVKPLQRQISEAVAINRSGADIILNSKSEWNSQRIPRVITEAGIRTTQTDHKGNF